MIILELRNITKCFGDTTVLNDLSLNVKYGKSIAIIGASGMGKTTLLNIASLLDIPTSGDVTYYGEKIRPKDYTEFRRKNISYVYQQHNLMQEFSVLENIKIIASLKDVYDEQYVIKLLKAVNLDNCIYKKPSELSGGQKQRVSIVRAIASKSKILFADEPTGNLDPKSANISADLLISLAKDEGVAIFLITHNMEIAHKCDIVYSLQNNGNLHKVK